jgi:hypothetical protein
MGLRYMGVPARLNCIGIQWHIDGTVMASVAGVVVAWRVPAR